jgi:hypothetical protein
MDQGIQTVTATAAPETTKAPKFGTFRRSG